MLSYIEIPSETNTGRGFVTHEDWGKLRFAGMGAIWVVEGDEALINAWVERVKGTIVEEDYAKKIIYETQLAGVNTELDGIDDRKTELTTLKTKLISDISILSEVKP